MPSASPVASPPALVSRLGLHFAGLVLLALLPLALLLLHLADAARDDHKRATLDRLLLSARLAAAVKTSAVDAVTETLTLLNRMPRDWAFTPRSCIDRLREVVAIHPQVAGIVVARDDGDVICASLGASGGTLPADGSHVRDALHRSEPVVGIPVANPRFGAAVLPIAMRMAAAAPDVNETPQVVVVMLDLATVEPLPASSPGRQNSESTEWQMVFAADGRLLAQHPPAATRSQGGHRFAPALLAAAHGVLELRGDDGAMRLIGFAHAGKAGTIHTVSVQADSVMQPGDLRIRAAAALLALTAMLSVALAFRLVRQRVLVPLTILQGFTALPQDHPLETGADARLPGEFEALGRAIVAMRQAMATRELSLRQVNRDLIRLADRDALTGIANRRAFDAALADAWAVATVNGECLGLAIIDIDAFKAFNDRHGHQGGDDCLRQVADTLRGMALRNRDLVARIGGEEFVLLLPETGADGAAAIAQRALGAIRGRMIRHADGLDGILTACAGVASCRPHAGLKPAALIAAADTALYCAKAAGSGRLVTARDVPEVVAEITTCNDFTPVRPAPLYV